VVTTLMPTVPQVHGLVALMELQASRLSARTGPSGEPVLLLDQNRGRWDALLIRRGLAALQRADDFGDGRDRYTLQAAIAACHARATRAENTDWARIVALYGVLAEVTHSPVVALNRAVAVSMAAGPQAGLDQVDELRTSGSLDGYHLLWSVRGDLLAKLGRMTEAAEDFERAAGLTENARERELTLTRAATARRGS
jgi:predicted RNA polymerase sigma factor